MMKRSMLAACVLCWCVLCLAGCAWLDGYARSYTVTYEDPMGRRLSVGMTLERRKAEQLAAVRMEPGGVLGKVVEVHEDAAAAPLQPASQSLAELTREAPSPKRETISMLPTTPVEGAMFLTRDGKLRLETDERWIRMYRSAGWVPAPMPAYDEERQSPPVWRQGRWVVR